MPRIDIPDGPGGDGAMGGLLCPEMAGMAQKMITTAYQSSTLPAAEREVARIRIAQFNACASLSPLPSPAGLAGPAARRLAASSRPFPLLV